jgi:uncharacterized protein (TIGR04255 family)
MSGSARVQFDRPPVVEVVCGVLFATAKPLHGAQLGLYWQRIREKFPRIEEAPPLIPRIEVPGVASGPLQFGLGLSDLPPLRRTWFLSEDGRRLIQVQEDRFIFNWRKTDGEDTYPSYDKVFELFEDNLSTFQDFLESEDIGTPAYRQFELSYIDHIPVGTGEDEISESRVLVDHIRDTSRPRFLGEPEAVNWISVYPLPDQEGRLYMAARSAFAPDGRRILLLEMTARGIPADAGEEGRRAWFDQAHRWITQGFVDLTDKEIQERIWKRTA